MDWMNRFATVGGVLKHGHGETKELTRPVQPRFDPELRKPHTLILKFVLAQCHGQKRHLLLEICRRLWINLWLKIPLRPQAAANSIRRA